MSSRSLRTDADRNPLLAWSKNSDAKDPGNPLAAFGIKAVDLKGRPSSSVVRDLGALDLGGPLAGVNLIKI